VVVEKQSECLSTKGGFPIRLVSPMQHPDADWGQDGNVRIVRPISEIGYLLIRKDSGNTERVVHYLFVYL
jgi:hypothetical protein